MPRLWGSVDFPDLITLYTSLPSSEKSWASKSMLFPLRTAEQPTAVSQSPPNVFKKLLSANAHISVLIWLIFFKIFLVSSSFSLHCTAIIPCPAVGINSFRENIC